MSTTSARPFWLASKGAFAMAMALATLSIASMMLMAGPSEVYAVGLLASAIVVVLSCVLSRHFGAPDAPRRDEACHRWHPLVTATAMLSAVAATVFVGVLYRLATGSVPPAPLVIAVAWGAFLASALLAWIVRLPNRVDRLSLRLGRVWSAAAAWSEPVHGTAEPKPSDPYRDLD